jgi:hypothetical protein
MTANLTPKSTLVLSAMTVIAADGITDEAKLQPIIETIAIKNYFPIISFPFLPKTKNSSMVSKNPECTVSPRRKISVVS